MSSSDEQSVGQAQQEDWDEWEEGEGDEHVKSLFSEAVFPSVVGALRADAASHGFDLRKYVLQEGLDQYDAMRVINFIRAQVAAGGDPLPALRRSGERPWQSDDHLTPVLPDDALLFHDWEEEAAAAAAAATAAPGVAQDAAKAPAGADAAALDALREENEALRNALCELTLEGAPGLRQLLLVRLDCRPEGEDNTAAEPGTSAVPAPAVGGVAAAAAGEVATRIDDNYFDSYSFFDIHHEMLADKVRTDAYRRALEDNPSLLAGKAVLDVGCGTGVLSMFAARSGAATVVGVDGSERIARFARANCVANGLLAGAGGEGGGQEGNAKAGGAKAGGVHIVSSKIEDLESLPGGVRKADVLVSEWMGYALLFESMLGSVLDARDRLLVPGGAVLPDLATLHLAAAGEGATGLRFWSDVYGLSMAPVAHSLRDSALKEALVRVVAPGDLLSQEVQLQSFDLSTMAPADQDFAADFRLEFGGGQSECHALVIWFDTHFSERFCKECPVTLSTSPYEPPTHWSQTVLVLREPVVVAPAAANVAGAAVALRGTLTVSRSKDRHRGLDLVLQCTAVEAGGRERDAGTTAYRMGVSSN